MSKVSGGEGSEEMFGATDTKRQVVSYVLHGERSGSWLVESPTVNYIRELHP